MDVIQGLYKKAYEEYALSVIEMEIELHMARIYRQTNKIQKYFNSSMNRNTFARIMVRAYIKDEGVSITEVCEILGANRSSVSVMVDETEKSGWMLVNRIANKASCMATDALYKAHINFICWNKKMHKKVVTENFKTLDQLESVLRKNDIEVPDGDDDLLLNSKPCNSSSVHPLVM